MLDRIVCAVKNRTVSFLPRTKLTKDKPSTSSSGNSDPEFEGTSLLTLHRYNITLERASDGVIRIIYPEEDMGEDLDEYHLNNREEIRRKLAMDSDNDDFYGGEKAVRKPSLQSRLQSGMNLQICFMNETVSDQEAALSDHDAEQTLKITHHPPAHEKPKNKEVIDSEADTAAVVRKAAEVSQGDETTDFISKQAKLQAEARLALAQAKQMAHMQMEIEKQRKKKSPIAEMVGIPFPDGRHKLSRQALSEMNLAQLQVIVNDLHTQIENLNEELVRLLLERDDLHMEQDSMLVDIEDLSGYL